MFKDIDVLKGAQSQYGSDIEIGIYGNHLWDWYVKKGNNHYPIDFNKAVKEQYGSSYSAVSVGVHAYDWKALSFSKLKYCYVPVLIVTPENWLDVQGVIVALERFDDVLKYAKNWYKSKLGKTFEYLKPIVIRSKWNVDQWEEFSELARISNPYDPNRASFAKHSYEDFIANYPLSNNLNYISAVYVGNRKDLLEGMANYSFDKSEFTALTPDVSGTSFNKDFLTYENKRMLSGSIHEIGHSLKLDHSKDKGSIMNNAQIPSAYLTEEEINIIKSSSFLRS